MINADDMQSWAYLLAPTFQFVNTSGKPLTEGWIEVYIAGTRDKYYCASDFNGTLHPFQIPLDSLGANIVLADPDKAYDVYVYNKYGSLIMSRYHVSPGMAGGSGVLNITITSEDGTVSVNNDGNGNFDLSIQDTIDRIDVLEQTVSGLSSNSSVGYAIAHAYTVELDGSFDLINDAVTGIGYTPNMDGFRLKSGHAYQFNFNALFENGAFDRNCSGKLYLEGTNTIAQEWKFDLDDSYYHSQSINGSTVLVTPNDLNYYDVKLKLAWDVDYPNKPNVNLNKISIVDITTILSTTVSGVGGNYTGGYGIQILNNVISVSGISPQVQSDWNQTNTSSVDYIKNKPEEYGLLAGDNISITASGNNFIISSTASAASGVNYQAGYGIDITGDTISVVSSIIPDAQINSDWTATSGKAEILNKPNESELIAGAGVSITASGSNYIISAVATGSFEQVQSDWTEDDTNNPAYIKNKPEEYGLLAGDNISITASGSNFIISAVATGSPIISGYVTEAELQTVSGNIVNQIPDVSNLATKQELSTVSASIPDISGLATNADLQIVSASIPDVSNLATKQEVATVSASIPDVSNFVTGPTVSAIVDESLIDVPSGVSGVVAGDGISITASGSDYIISCTVTGGGSGTTYTAGDYIGIVDETISVTGVIDVVAGNCVSITSSGNSAVIDWSTTGGITDIQIVNSLPASPLSTVLYLIPET